MLIVGTATFLSVQAQDAKPAAADVATESEGPKDIRFLAFNVKNWLRQDRFVNGERVEDVGKPEEEKTAVIGMIARLRPEILGICEIGDMKDVEDFKTRLKGVGLEYPHLEWVNAADPVRHLVLLSQFTIVATNSKSDLVYKMEGSAKSGKAEIEVPVWRGILDATVQVNEDYQLRCIGAHLKSKREVPEGSQALMRRNEAHLFRQHIEKIYDESPNSNLIVYGDFNDTRNEPPIKAIQGKFGTDRYLWSLKLADINGYRWTHHWDFADIYSRIDFIFVSPGLTREVNRDRSFVYHRKDWDKASDHRPLVAAIRPVNLDDR